MRMFLTLYVVMLMGASGGITSGIKDSDPSPYFKGVQKISDSLSDGTPVKIEVETIKFTGTQSCRNGVLWSCEDIFLPKTVVKAIGVHIGNEKIDIPFSAYADLGDVSSVLFKKTKEGFELYINGADAGCSYRAVLEFSEKRILRRKIASSECGGGEETVYLESECQ